MVLPDSCNGLLVVLEGRLVVSNAVVDPADLEGDVLVGVQDVVVGPQSRDASAQVVAQLLTTCGSLSQQRVPELEEHIWIPVAELQNGRHRAKRRVGQVLLQTLLQHEEVVGTELVHKVRECSQQVREVLVAGLVQLRQRGAQVHVWRHLVRTLEEVLRSEHEGTDFQRRFFLRVVQCEAASAGEPRSDGVIIYHEREGAVDCDVRIHQAAELFGVVVALIAGDHQRSVVREGPQVAKGSDGADRHEDGGSVGAVLEVL
mmetsp:Transcript_208/g.259  ORF Transcript_208/g.259 Transcript_208/m.259 type:complete len:259 (-) Transcript_208:914-1690(-)